MDKDFRILKMLSPPKKKCDNGTERYSTTGTPKMFPTVAISFG
jgi:hypothetical protein